MRSKTKVILVATISILLTGCISQHKYKADSIIEPDTVWGEQASTRATQEAAKIAETNEIQQAALQVDPNVYMQNNCFHSYMIGSKAKASDATWYFTVFDKSCGIKINGVACSVMYNVGDKSIKEFC